MPRFTCSLALSVLAFLASLCPTSATAQPNPLVPLSPIDGRRVALVIGNSDYTNGASWPELANARRDAEYIAATLSSPERGSARFEVDLVRDGTRAEIIAHLRAFAERAAAADVAVVYFSGHGFEYNLDNYIVPADAPGSVDDGNVSQRYVNMADVVAAAGSRGFSLFFLDACRTAGPVLRISDSTEGHRASLFGAINAPQSVVFYSTALGDSAYDDAPAGSLLSPFAAAVGRAMNERGLDVPYMFTSVREMVLRTTSDRRPPQVPQFGGSWSRPFFFLPPMRVASAAVTSVSGAAAAPVRPRLAIPLETLSTLDEPILITRVLEERSPADLVALGDNGDPLALYLVGYMYEFGVGLPRDLTEARRWLERAASSGHPAGQLELGYFLLTHGTSDERRRALDLYRSASAQGYAKAKSHLAAALLQGSFGPVNRDEALQLMREAAAAGHAYAIQALALMGEDRAINIRRLEQLARDGNSEGDSWLCEMGSMGMPIDSQLAHCLAAAKAGYSDQRAHLALLYASGVFGAEKSPQKARYWARLALSRNDLRADLRARVFPLAALAPGVS